MFNLSHLNQAVHAFTGLTVRLLTGKVDKVEGKQLSTEDYTAEDKAKVSGIGSMGLSDLHVSEELPTDSQGSDGDIWLVVEP